VIARRRVSAWNRQYLSATWFASVGPANPGDPRTNLVPIAPGLALTEIIALVRAV